MNRRVDEDNKSTPTYIPEIDVNAATRGNQALDQISNIDARVSTNTSPNTISTRSEEYVDTLNIDSDMRVTTTVTSAGAATESVKNAASYSSPEYKKVHAARHQDSEKQASTMAVSKDEKHLLTEKWKGDMNREHNTRYINLCTIAEESHGLCVDDHDTIIWLGDLNYRIHEDVADSDVFTYIDENNCLELADKYDQLSLEKDRGRVFEDFHEGLLSFPPTYKYIPGTVNYDRKKNRCPAWCDRVLWRTRVTRKSKSTKILDDNEIEIIENKLKKHQEAMLSMGSSSNDNDDENVMHAKDLYHFLNEIDVGLGFSKAPILSNSRNDGSLASKNLYALQTMRRDIFNDYGSNGLSNPESTAVSLMLYTSIMDFPISDHKPVVAMLNLKVRRVDWARREKFLLDLMQKYTSYESYYDMKQMIAINGTALVTSQPRSLLMYTNNAEFTQEFFTISNNSQEHDLAIDVCSDDFPDWLRVTHTLEVPTSDGTDGSECTTVVREYTKDRHGDDYGPIPLNAGQCTTFWVTTNNVEAMVLYAGTLCDGPLLKVMGEDLNEVSHTISLRVTRADCSSGVVDNEENTASEILISRVLVPVVLALRGEPSNGEVRQTGQVDSPSLLYKLNSRTT